ncbi:MAG: hypothetical protein PF444_04390 [Bacteroidales bacterium]|nr:hypothetical protein [Bacteroidales bacterium]
MKTIFTLLILALSPMLLSAQSTVDLAQLDAAYTTTFEGELVIDIAKAASTIASPALSISNPFSGKTLTRAEISFDVYNYGEIKVLGALLSFYDASLGRLYFTNGSYLGLNITGVGFIDANLLDYALENDFIGSNQWKNIKLQFTATGFSILVDDVVVITEASTKAADNITVAGDITDYSAILPFLSNASVVAFGTGSWWSDNTMDDGVTHWDPQNSYMKNITFTGEISTSIEATQPVSEQATKVQYYTLSGVALTTDFYSLESGIYIKKSTFEDGRIMAETIAKATRD